MVDAAGQFRNFSVNTLKLFLCDLNLLCLSFDVFYRVIQTVRGAFGVSDQFADDTRDTVGCFLGLFRKLPDFFRYHRKPFSGFPGSCRFYGGVESQQVCLRGDTENIANNAFHIVNAG